MAKPIEHKTPQPSWETVARIYSAAIEHNDQKTLEGRRAAVNAREGLIQMGELLDKCIAELKLNGVIE